VVSALSLSGTVDLNGGQPVGGNKTAVYNHPYTSDNDPSDIDWIESIAWSVGGNDAIRTLGDNDIAIGGAGADLIKVGAGQSLVFGDAGQIAAAAADGDRFASGAQFAGGANLALGRMVSTAPAVGDNDRIISTGGSDIIFGGMSGGTSTGAPNDDANASSSTNYYDALDAGAGNNIVVGDSGFLIFARAIGDATATVTLVVTVDPTKPVPADALNGGVPSNSTNSAAYNYSYTADDAANDIDWLNQIRRRGDVLIVAVYSDAAARRVGRRRPLHPAADRAATVAALSGVDHVTITEDESPVELFDAVSPHVYLPPKYFEEGRKP